MYPKGVKKELIARHKRGEIPEWSTKAGQEFSHKELLAFGILEVALPETEDHCSNLVNGLCSLHGPNKPRLCASYWCHGRLWQARGLQTAKNLV